MVSLFSDSSICIIIVLIICTTKTYFLEIDEYFCETRVFLKIEKLVFSPKNGSFQENNSYENWKCFKWWLVPLYNESVRTELSTLSKMMTT